MVMATCVVVASTFSHVNDTLTPALSNTTMASVVVVVVAEIDMYFKCSGCSCRNVVVVVVDMQWWFW